MKPCSFSSPTTVALPLAYCFCLALMSGHLWHLRKTPAVAKRCVSLFFMYIALVAFGGLVMILDVSCGKERSAAHAMIVIAYAYIHMPMMAFLFFLRMILLMETEIRNQSFLLLSHSDNRNASSLRLSRFDNLVLRFLGFQNAISQIGGEASEKISFSPSSIFRSVAINIVIFACVFLGILVVIRFLFASDFESVASYSKVFWAGVLVATIPYQAYCFYFYTHIMKIKDPYLIRAELFASSAVAAVGFLCVLIAIIVNAEYLEPSGVNIYILAFCYSNVVLLVSSYIFVIIARWKKNRRNNCNKMPISEFEIALNNADFLNQLKPQLAKDFCMENAIFLEEFDRLTANMNSIVNLKSERTTMFEKCYVLYEKYVEDEGPYELNLPHDFRDQLQKKIRSREIQLTDFVRVRRLVATMIYENTYPRYLAKLQKDVNRSNTAL